MSATPDVCLAHPLVDVRATDGAMGTNDRDSAISSVLLDILEPFAGVCLRRGREDLARQALELLDAATLDAARAKGRAK